MAPQVRDARRVTSSVPLLATLCESPKDYHFGCPTESLQSILDPNPLTWWCQGGCLVAQQTLPTIGISTSQEWPTLPHMLRGELDNHPNTCAPPNPHLSSQGKFCRRIKTHEYRNFWRHTKYRDGTKVIYGPTGIRHKSRYMHPTLHYGKKLGGNCIHRASLHTCYK